MKTIKCPKCNGKGYVNMDILVPPITTATTGKKISILHDCTFCKSTGKTNMEIKDLRKISKVIK